MSLKQGSKKVLKYAEVILSKFFEAIQSWPCTRIYQGYSFGVLINSPSIKVRFLNQYLDFSPTLLDTKVLDDILDTLHANTRIELVGLLLSFFFHVRLIIIDITIHVP